MISKIRKWISNKRLLHGVSGIEAIPTAIAPIAQVDVRTAATEKRVTKSMDDQLRQVHAMSLIPHASGCDIFNCKKTYCFKYEPDRIVSGSESKMQVGGSKEIENLDDYK